EIYPKDTVEKILRVRDAYLHFLKSPAATDSELVRQITTRFRVSRPTAYSDLSIVKALLPSLGDVSRKFHKWRSIEMLLETYRLAKGKMDVRTMERISSTYARVTNADQPEEETIDLSAVVPVPWVPTDDPSVIGLKRLENREKKISELLKEFAAQDPDILDVDFEEADIPSDKL
ncbi:MAG: hypothetical protein K2G90_00520, partial [Muribaculaceae bacterium]|nr:hypothetical protein [Muribaculaceae bacterium]